MNTVTGLWRHPLKSHGREEREEITLNAGEAMPFDRLWAVAHEASRADGAEWVSCANFSRVSKAPELMAITSKLDESAGVLTLSHPNRPDLTFNPDADTATFIKWVMPIVPSDRALPSRIIRLEGRGFTDSDFPSVTLCNRASHRAVEVQVGHDLSMQRWRGNIWFESEDPWVESDWIGRDLAIGDCILRPRERTDRCLATHTNPDTGTRDIDILAALDHFGHQDFSVRAEVIKGGRITRGDQIRVLA